MEDGKVKINEFDGKDFGFLRMQIEDYVYQRNLHFPSWEKKPNSMPEAEWEHLDLQTLGVSRFTLAGNSILWTRKRLQTCSRFSQTCIRNPRP